MVWIKQRINYVIFYYSHVIENKKFIVKKKRSHDIEGVKQKHWGHELVWYVSMDSWWILYIEKLNILNINTNNIYNGLIPKKSNYISEFMVILKIEQFMDMWHHHVNAKKIILYGIMVVFICANLHAPVLNIVITVAYVGRVIVVVV